MSQQLDRIENSIPQPKDVKDYKLDPTRPIYQYHTPSNQELKGMSLGRDTTHKIEELVTKLKSLNIETSSGEINTLSRDEEYDNMVSKLGRRAPRPKTRNYYPRPSFVDVQFEERSNFIENNYSGESIVEWNIDGASEQQVLDTIQNMTMAATAFKLKGNTDKHTKEILVMGFTGQLKGWWDNLLSSEDKYQIDAAAKTESNEEICVTTLLYAITKFFVGEPLKLQQRAVDQLLNLYCPTMSDYRWYRDMFLSKLCLRSDGAADYWKERFISGLPGLFAEKVKINIKQNFNGMIPYQSLTIGELSNYVIETGIQICTDYKLQNKIKNEKASNRREMGSFCEQYGATPLRALSNPKNKNPARKGRNNFRYHKKQFYKDKPEFYKNLTRKIMVRNLTENIIINLNPRIKMLNAISVVVLAIMLINVRFKKRLIN